MFECDGAALGSRLLGTLGGPVSAATISVAATRSTHTTVTSAICIRIRWCSNVANIASSSLRSVGEGGKNATTPPPWVLLSVVRSWAIPFSFPAFRTSLLRSVVGAVLVFYWQVVGELRGAGPSLEGG